MKTKKNKKDLLLHLPDDIFEIMKLYKETSGVAYTNIIYNALVWWLVKEGLLDLDYIKKKSKELINENGKGYK